MRGATLIEVMVAVAVLSIASGVTFLEVSQYRAGVFEVRRGYHALECGEREVEWLSAQPAPALRALAQAAYAPRFCEGPKPAMRLGHRAAQGVFVLEVEVKPSAGPPRVVALPFAPRSAR